MRPVENVSKWLRKWRVVTGVEPRVVCQEHGHVSGMAVARDDPTILLIQSPALSKDVDYQVNPRLCYGPNQRGFVRLTQHHGVTDWNESRFYLYPGAQEQAA
jgi:hypothetical protein